MIICQLCGDVVTLTANPTPAIPVPPSSEPS